MGTSDIWYGVVTSRSSRQEPRIRLADHPFFRGMNSSWVEAVGYDSEDATYLPGELLIREGEVAKRFHLIFHGEVALEVGGPTGRRRVVQTVGPGEVLDWSWISPPFLWQFDGRALKETRVVSLDTTVLRRAMESRPVEGVRFLERLLPVVGQRLENTRARLGEVAAR